MTIKKQILLSFILLSFLFNINIIIESVFDVTYLFFNKIFVSIFPFIILSKILIYYDYHIFLSNTIGKILSKLFNIDKNATIVFILSILTSMPCNSIYINNLLNEKIIDENTANKLIIYTYFPSIAFVIGSIGVNMYNNIYIGISLLLINYLCNIVMGIFLRKEKNTISIAVPNKVKEDFFVLLKSSIIDAFNTCLIILGNIIIFSIIINIINTYININPIVNSILSELLELTNGINNIYLLNISLKYKLFLTSFILNFSGLSIIFQSKSILSNYNINIKKILIIKLIFSIIFSLLFCYL